MFNRSLDTAFLVIFDFDGVLSNSKEAYANQMLETLEFFSITNITLEEVKARVGNTDQTLDFIEFFQTNNQALIDSAMKKYVELTEKYAYQRELFPGVIEILEVLHKKNFLAIVSRKPQERMDYWLKHFNITHFFDIPIGTIENTKADAIKHIMGELKISKSRTIMVGDTEFDILSAKRAGVYSVLALYDAADPENALKSEPDYCINKLSEIFDVIEKIKQKNALI
ncbi:MAG: HAD family hydrolase [Candidatus Thorarchaeota archaeon]